MKTTLGLAASTGFGSVWEELKEQSNKGLCEVSHPNSAASGQWLTEHSPTSPLGHRAAAWVLIDRLPTCLCSALSPEVVRHSASQEADRQHIFLKEVTHLSGYQQPGDLGIAGAQLGAGGENES